MDSTKIIPLGVSKKAGRGYKKITGSREIRQKAFLLALAGGLAFWLANFAISRTSIAAEYRAAMSISYTPMLLESLIGGLIIGICVGYFLVRFFDKIPTKNPVLKAVLLSFVLLILITILIANPSNYLATSDVTRYFLIGTIFNVIRILALGVSIGYLYTRMDKRSDPAAADASTNSL